MPAYQNTFPPTSLMPGDVGFSFNNEAFPGSAIAGSQFAIPSYAGRPDTGTAVRWQTIFGTAPTAVNMVLQGAMADVDAEYQTLDTTTATPWFCCAFKLVRLLDTPLWRAADRAVIQVMQDHELHKACKNKESTSFCPRCFGKRSSWRRQSTVATRCFSGALIPSWKLHSSRSSGKAFRVRITRATTNPSTSLPGRTGRRRGSATAAMKAMCTAIRAPSFCSSASMS
jgi:hypothetical protein